MAKVSRPIIKDVYPRKRLFRLLDHRRERPVIWVSGAAGCGKTTLVSSYLEARGIPCLWYQLDEGDADPATFFYYLGQAAKKISPHKRKQLPLLTPEYRQGIPTFTRRYFEDLYSGLKTPSVVVFDNFQDVAEGSSFHKVILVGLSQIPEGVNVILVSRKDPPPLFIRLQANQVMDILGWNELRLRPEESEGIVRLRSKMKWSPEWINYLHHITKGWAAGLVLMIENAKREGIEPQMAGELTPEEIFEYFGQELFDGVDKEIQDFFLKTAFLPKMTSRMVEGLTGIPNAGRILSALSRDNYFTVKSFQNEPIYQYHPLFRDFLLARARDTYSRETLAALLGRAAVVLEEAGQVEAAVSLLQDVGDWHRLVNLILKEAPSMVDHGRYRPLEDWLGSLPREIMESNPWLLQWMGTSRLLFDPLQSQIYFGKAYEGFKAKNDNPGIILALWGMFQAIRVSGGDLKQLDRWIPVMEEWNRRFKVFPSPEAELRFVSTVTGTLVYRQPDHPEVQKWTERAFSLARRSLSVELMDLKIEVLSQLVSYYNLIGEFEKSIPAMDALRNINQGKNLRPIVHLWVKRAEAIHYRCIVQNEKCLKTVSDALELSRTTGIHVLDHFMLTQGISSALNANDVQKAEYWLDQEGLSYPILGPWHRATHHLQRTRVALLRGDFSQAAFHADLALALSTEAGAPYTLAYSHMVNSLIKHVLGKPKEAKNHLREILDIGQRIRAKIYEFSALLLEALFAFDQGEEASGLIFLRKAFTLGRERGYYYPYVDLGMPRLCIKALNNGIEVEYVRELIRRCRIQPDPASWDLEDWPWPLDINILGRFALKKDGKGLPFPKRIKQKPLLLLKVLLSLGGREVREEKISDELWPEAEGDLAHKAFATNLHRLRKLMGFPEALQFRDGRLSLDPRCCRVDAWVFEHLLKQAEEKKKTGEMKTAVQLTEKAIAKYRGDFLAEEEEKPWLAPLRERLRNRFSRAVIWFGHYCENKKQWEKAIESYERLLEADPVAEEIYQRLMNCCQHLGRKVQAQSAYRRCCKSLSSILGMRPTEKTERIYQEILRSV